jgi:hypothetical protein
MLRLVILQHRYCDNLFYFAAKKLETRYTQATGTKLIYSSPVLRSPYRSGRQYMDIHLIFYFAFSLGAFHGKMFTSICSYWTSVDSF